MNKCLRRSVIIFRLFFLLITTCAFYSVNATIKIDSLYKIVVKTQLNDTDRYSTWQLIALEYESQINIDSFNYAIKEMVSVAYNSKNDTLIADAYTTLGMIHENNSDFSHSLEYYFKALKIAERLKYKLAVCMISESMAVVYKQLYEVEETLKYLKIAERYIDLPEVKVTYLPRGIYLNKAEILMYAGQLDSGLYYIEKANKIIDRKNDQFGISRLIFNYGEYYFKQHEYSKAEKYFLEGIAYSDSVKMRINLIENYNSYAKLLLKTGKPVAAKKIALISLAKHKQFINQVGTLSIEIAKILSDVYAALKIYDSAYYYSKLNITSRDSIYNLQRLNEIESMEQMRMIASVEGDQKMKEENNRQQLQKQKIIRNYTVAGAVLLFIVFALLINRQKLKRKVEIESMRSRISRDLHDDIGSTLSSINILSHTANLNLNSENLKKTKETLLKINERAEGLMTNMNDIVWNLKPGNDSMEQVAFRMREYASTILEAKNIQYKISFPDKIEQVKLSMEEKSNLLLIFKEAVNNLAKYADCTNADIQLMYVSKNIFLKISDNGKGFAIGELKRNGGLTNMQKRANEIKALLKINSVVSEGTTIELTLPIFS